MTLKTRSVKIPWDTDLYNKENVKLQGGKSRGPAMAKMAKARCLCQRPDDGSPMIRCESCRVWYHFRCIDLSERDAEDIQIYVCSYCLVKTSLRTIMDWEGVDGLEGTTNLYVQQDCTEGSKSTCDELAEEDPSELGVGSSEDEYIADISQLDAEELSDSRIVTRRLRRSKTQSRGSPTRSPPSSPDTEGIVKRRRYLVSAHMIKRARTESDDDPTRKYCLTKLQEIFIPIFLQYFTIRYEKNISPADGSSAAIQEDLTEDARQVQETKAKKFAQDLEQCLYDLYSEHDRSGKPAAGGKYKERFRMLTFNLSKSDRVSLHKRIASSQITPKELSTMTSTDLADEETKQSIKQAEQEALAHSILKKQSLPRAKITHKGIENIEDDNGAEQRDLERAHEEEEEERIERERLARLRLQAERAHSSANLRQSAPAPDPAILPQPADWDMSAQTSTHSLHPNDGDASHTYTPDRPDPRSMFVHSASDLNGSAQAELNLADLINIDEEMPADIVARPPVTIEPSISGIREQASSTMCPQAESRSLMPSSLTAISPFAAKSNVSSASFDLKTLWSVGGGEIPVEISVETEAEESARQPTPKELPGDSDIGGEVADDQDFDMFLSKEEDGKKLVPARGHSPNDTLAMFETWSMVWAGTLSMPLDTTVVQEVSLTASQIGGRLLDTRSLLWQTLFPSKELRIDGRVPVEKSAQYLTQMRLNPSKELIAVAFRPNSGAGFKALVDHLVAKGRHGLIFPWGNRPKDWAPGRELYIVPLLVSDAVPEYMELLDNLRLPTFRKDTYLIGIWVLTKGKLSPPPVTTANATISYAPTSSSPLPSYLPFISEPRPQMPSVASPQQSVHADAALAAEVAQLTPEQIQVMLRTLTSSSLLSNAAPTLQATYPQASVLTGQGFIPQPAIPVQTWPNMTSLDFPPIPQSSSPTVAAPTLLPLESYIKPHFETQYHPRSNSERGINRGNRGGGGGRNRGRTREHDRPRDSGWPRRRGRGGTDAANQPSHGEDWSGHPRRT